MIQGLLLAGGSGHRFGGQKLLARLPGGEPVVVAAARALQAGADRVLAVTRPGERELAAVLERAGVAVAPSTKCAEGMGASLSAGVAAAHGADGWLVALGDMPWVRDGTVVRVARCLREGAAIAVPEHVGRGGHPVGFSRAYGPVLERLGGDRGGRDVLRAACDRIVRVPVDDSGILRDVDRPEDLGWRGAHRRRTIVASGSAGS
ncbi:nucleotidyltransferase family protein [Thiohalorhabdus sp. Cl-TMA]|uniref:NTP transferase domain-containing protein n=1 Tax=Thiohalorhabdus methylotrophus TaxID=3242694 RepID=A0ABV4TXL7_9GAMM